MQAIENYTYDDYVLWEGRWELIEGFPLAMSPSPTIIHQTIASNILFEIRRSMGECENCVVITEEDWKVNENTVLKPDVVLICNELNDNYITKSPELVVEVISSSTAKRDEKFKFNIYEKEKVPYYILAYPKEFKAKIFKLKGDKYSKEGDFFTEIYNFDGLTCPVRIDFDAVFKILRNKKTS